MAKPQGKEICHQRVTAEAQRPQAASKEPLLPQPSIDVPVDEAIPPAISIVAQVRHFRAPPTLG
jgi:hypothetical protein